MTACRNISANVESDAANIVRLPNRNYLETQTQDIQFTDRTLNILNRLRWLALRAKCSSCEELEKACFAIAGDENTSFERYTTLFFHGLRKRSRRDIIVHTPGSKTVSRDEVWLLNMLSILGQPNCNILSSLAWHVEPSAERWMQFLAKGMQITLPENRD